MMFMNTSTEHLNAHAVPVPVCVYKKDGKEGRAASCLLAVAPHDN